MLKKKQQKTQKAQKIRSVKSVQSDVKEEKQAPKFIGNMYNKSSDGLSAGDKVTHTVFGDGVVIKVSGGIATIAFSHKVGIKSIAANHKYLTKR